MGRWEGALGSDDSHLPPHPENYFSTSPHKTLAKATAPAAGRAAAEGERGRGATQTGGGPERRRDRGRGEAKSQSQSGGGQKKSAREGTNSLALDAAKLEPEPEPVRPPASASVIAHPCLPVSPHRRRRIPPPAARAPGSVPGSGELALLHESPLPAPPSSVAGAPRPDLTGTSLLSRESPPTGSTGKNLRLCRLRASPGLRGMGSTPRR